MGQSGITLLPDRDYYLKDDPKLAEARSQYLAYLQTIFTLIKRADPAGDAKAVVALETEVAKAQWPAADLRDPVKRYNKYTLARLAEEMPGFDWSAWATAQGFANVQDVIVGQPSFFKVYASLADTTPLATWKAWLTAHLVSEEAEFLSKPFADAHFEFFDRTLRGQQAMRPRPERAVQLVNTSLGEAVGRIYVDKYFPAEAKVRMQQMVANLLEAYRQSISTVDWMTPETRTRALDKLSKFMPQIGYPDTWRSYDGARDQGGRPGRQRDAGRQVRTNLPPRQAGEAGRSRRVGDDAADGQRVLLAGAEQDRLPGSHPAAAVLPVRRRRCGELRRDRCGDRPRDRSRLRRLRAAVRRDGHAPRLVAAARRSGVPQACADAGGTVQSVHAAARPARERTADAGRKHRRPRRAGHRLQGLQGVARRHGRRRPSTASAAISASSSASPRSGARRCATSRCACRS